MRPDRAATQPASQWLFLHRFLGEGSSRGTYQVLIVEEVHHSGRPVTRGDQVGRRPVQTQQAQGGALLRAVHGVPERQAQRSRTTQLARPGAARTPAPANRAGATGAAGRTRRGESALPPQGEDCSKELPGPSLIRTGKEQPERPLLQWPWLCG